MINMKSLYLSAILITLFAMILMLCLPGAAMAKTGYVSDELIITLRAGKGADFKIIDYLNTGTRLEVLQEDENYMRVRTQDGKEGWVLKRYVTFEPPKAEVIADLTEKIESMKTNMNDIENIVAERDKLLEENKRLKAENEEYAQDLKNVERKELMYWFLAGAGVLFLGWIIGKASRQKRFY